LVLGAISISTFFVEQAFSQTKPVPDNFSPGARAHYERVDWNSPGGASHIVGFNYQPSWAETGIKSWLDDFDAKKFRDELENAKNHFPDMNTVRLWLHYGAWEKDPGTYLKNVQKAFKICYDLDLLIIPILTSSWGKEAWGLQVENPNTLTRMEEYFLAVNEVSREGANILVWDICNEPPKENEEWDTWLIKMSSLIHERFTANKRTIGYGHHGSWTQLHLLPNVDMWSPHFYRPFAHNATDTTSSRKSKEEYEKHKKEFREGVTNWHSEIYLKAQESNKPIMANECCWGSLDDAFRVKIIEGTLGVFVDLGIGFTPHAVQESLAPDLHRPQFGQVDNPGFMGFIMIDGTLRPGHDIFNKYAKMAVYGK
jgi:hypothetical protein